MSAPTKEPPSSNVQRWRVAGICLALAAITFAVFGQTAGFGFVDFDDGLYVYENATVASGLSLKGLVWVFTHADCHFYHPLTMLSLMADYQLYGLHAGGYHLTNVLLHAASAILLFLVLCQMTGALWRSAFVAAVFAIHPLRVESVAWVAERKDVLGTFFFMVTLGAYVHFVRKPNSLARYLMVIAMFALALLSKPTMVTLPFVLLLLDYWPLHRFEPRKLSRLILEKIPLLVLSAGACVMTVLAEGKDAIASVARVSLLARIGNALVSYVLYLREMIWPGGLAPFYPLSEKGYPVWITALSFLVLALISGAVLVFGRKRRWLLTGWLWYLGMLMPMIGLVQVGGFAHADRMTYLPQIGIYLAVTWLAAEWGAKWQAWRAAFGGLMAGVLVALIICAWKQTAYWKNSETLWLHTIACTTDNYAAHNNLGNELLQQGRADEAIAHYQASLEIKPDNVEAHNNLGVALDQRGRVDEAIAHFQKALQIKPDSAETHNSLGADLLQMGKVEEAASHFQQALQIRPDYAKAHLNLGRVLFQNGRMDEAITRYREALEITPGDAEARLSLGNALLQKGSVDDAISEYQNALQISPAFADAHLNIGIAFSQKGNADKAMVHFQKALELKPNDAGTQNNLAWLLATCPQASLRNGNKAVELARQANALTGGENPMILHTLAAALAEAGRFGDARDSVQKAIELARAAGRQDMVEQFNGELKRYELGLPLHQ